MNYAITELEGNLSSGQLEEIINLDYLIFNDSRMEKKRRSTIAETKASSLTWSMMMQLLSPLK